MSFTPTVPGEPIDYSKWHAWTGFGVVLGTNLLGLIVVLLRRDIVCCIAATWVCVSIWSYRPKPSPVYVRHLFFFLRDVANTELSMSRSRSLSLLCYSRSHSSHRSSTRDITDKDALFFRLGMRTPDFMLIPTVRTGLRGTMALTRRGHLEKLIVIGPKTSAV